MADPLITDAELVDLINSPEMAADDAGSFKARSLHDIIEAIKFTDARRARKRGPFAAITLPIMPGMIGQPIPNAGGEL